VAARTFFRAFTIQGSWNYRNMIGNGFAFALLPVLRALYDGDRLDQAVERHAEHFNAHPYLTNVALGAVARMEAEGRDPELVQRFKQAVGGPLGGLGDTLVWATLLPSTLLLALILAWVGVRPWLVVLTFLALYNAGHLALRIWAFRLGLREGKDVAIHLRRARLGGRAEELARLGSFLVGVFLGLVVLSEPGLGDPRWFGTLLAAAAVGVGVWSGQRAWRPTALAVVGVVAAILATRAFLQ
jgi:mannose/fructose/N-acetylgalactosamine-specific phosphotransferase system component IID